MSFQPNGNLLIANNWLTGAGSGFESRCPVDNGTVWAGKEATSAQVDSAFAAARDASGPWWELGAAARIKICQLYADRVKQKGDELAHLISRETGKPVWESKTEVSAVVGKIALSVQAFQERRDTRSFEIGDAQAVTRYKPFGVCGVLGPFNFPAHLANGHIVPALIAGNTIVFKPSEQSPAVGEWMVHQWLASGLPAGVLNLVQGARDVGVSIVNHSMLDGIFFTGSSAAGKAIHQSMAPFPQKIVALEMGGNNPLIVHQVNSSRAAAYNTILSAYFTAGQRCTCARRLILVDNENSRDFVKTLVEMIGNIRLGFYSDEPEPFMGTVISGEQGRKLITAQRNLIALGAKPIIEMKSHRGCDALISPGLLDATEIEREDEELFGPLLNIIRVQDFDGAIAEANNTAYGLSAALLCDDRDCYDQFIQRIRAGIVNWNRPTTGATGQLPFGGCGMSGNNRPSAYFAADYCSWPVASMESAVLELPAKPVIGISF